MKMMRLLVCLVCVAVTQVASQVDPRGARPVEPATRSDKCSTQKEWPFCTDDDWISKCPSGCRIQGLMDKADHELLKKIEKIRSLLSQNKAKHRSTDQVSKQTYDYLRDRLTTDSGNNNNYYDLAQSLRQRITDMKIRIDGQMNTLAALKNRVKNQVNEMQRLEVDIDIKLRSCKGSCAGYSEYQVDKESYVNLDKQMRQLESQSAQNIESVGTLYVMKTSSLAAETRFKSKDVGAQKKDDVFSEVKTLQFVLEQEGSSSSPATVSKEPGTSQLQGTPAPLLPSSSSSSSKSITQLGGPGDFPGGFGTFDNSNQDRSHYVSTKTSSCTKTIKRTVVHTKDGPVEKMEEVMQGGPECRGMTELTKGGMSSLFPTLTHTSSSSSGGAKGSLLGDSKLGFMDPFRDDGFDLGAFMPDNAEDDVPDFHARSVKSAPVERQDDFVGKDCVDAYQKHLKGETNGLFKIKPGGTDSTVVEVYCHQEGIMGGWLLVQQRASGSVSFNRTWAEYRDGFGSVDAEGKGELWLGNQILHLLTNQSETMLKVELEDWEGGAATAEYSVRVGSKEEGYPLQVSGFTGDAGDALLKSHSGMKFSTFDKDDDKWERNCAEVYGGGWWYNSCQSANLNGVYYRGSYDPKGNAPHQAENGVVWTTFKPATYSLKAVRMFVRPAEF